MNQIEQTKSWVEFRKSAKNEKFWEINIEKDGKKKLSAFVQKMSLPLGKSWLYCNRGPVFHELSEGFLTEFLERVREIVKAENAVFLRIEPPFKVDTEEAKWFIDEVQDIGFQDAHASHQPEYTILINLEAPEEEILAQMKQKGRYNIRLAEKKGVRISESKDIDSFYKLFEETTERDQFTGHNKDFYKKMLEILGSDDMVKLYLAEYEGKILAGIIVIFYKDTATYYYGASSDRDRNVMAPYLLQWHAMKEAKKRGMKYYDLLGIAPPDQPEHPWAGISKFKMKFGGKTVQYVKAQEYVFKPFWYWVVKTVKKIKKQ